MQAQNVWIRTLYDRHRFVVRGNLGWIETDDFDKVPPDLRFFAGGDRSIRGYKYKSIAPKDDDGKLIGPRSWPPARWNISTTSAVNGGARCLSIAAKR
jgi:outer membrane translocation and assembly module TamA